MHQQPCNAPKCPRHRSRRQKKRQYIFVLWGKSFEAVDATVFVTELRRAGLPVKLVGLSSRQALSYHGLALVPDWGLEKALNYTDQTFCVIVPCGPIGLPRLKTDPRVQIFLQAAEANHATFIMEQKTSSELLNFLLKPSLEENVYLYDDEELIPFARDMGTQFYHQLFHSRRSRTPSKKIQFYEN